MHTTPALCKEKNHWIPIILQVFLKTPRFIDFYSYKMVALTPWGKF